MTRDEYISFKENGGPILFLLYEYYKEHFDGSKYMQFLSPEEFTKYITMWPGFKMAIDKVIRYYDNHFAVVTLFDKNGESIKQL